MHLPIVFSVYAFGIQGVSLIVHMVSIYRYYHACQNLIGIERSTQLRANHIQLKIFSYLWYVFACGPFFWGMQFAWKDSAIPCYDGWNIWFFTNFLITMGASAPGGLLLGLLILFTPCLIGFWADLVTALRHLYNGLVYG